MTQSILLFTFEDFKPWPDQPDKDQPFEQKGSLGTKHGPPIVSSLHQLNGRIPTFLTITVITIGYYAPEESRWSLMGHILEVTGCRPDFFDSANTGAARRELSNDRDPALKEALKSGQDSEKQDEIAFAGGHLFLRRCFADAEGHAACAIDHRSGSWRHG